MLAIAIFYNDIFSTTIFPHFDPLSEMLHFNAASPLRLTSKQPLMIG